MTKAELLAEWTLTRNKARETTDDKEGEECMAKCDKLLQEIEAAENDEHDLIATMSDLVVKLSDYAQCAIDEGDYSRANRWIADADYHRDILFHLCGEDPVRMKDEIKAATDRRFGGY